MTQQQQQYQLGDLVGLQIDDRSVNRINKTSLILPCKVISIQSSSNHFTMYKLCTLKGILSTLYGIQDLFDLRKYDFPNLRTVDPAALPTIAFIQACEEYVAAIGMWIQQEDYAILMVNVLQNLAYAKLKILDDVQNVIRKRNMFVLISNDSCGYLSVICCISIVSRFFSFCVSS